MWLQDTREDTDLDVRPEDTQKMRPRPRAEFFILLLDDVNESDWKYVIPVSLSPLPNDVYRTVCGSRFDEMRWGDELQIDTYSTLEHVFNATKAPSKTCSAEKFFCCDIINTPSSLLSQPNIVSFITLLSHRLRLYGLCISDLSTFFFLKNLKSHRFRISFPPWSVFT